MANYRTHLKIGGLVGFITASTLCLLDELNELNKDHDQSSTSK